MATKLRIPVGALLVVGVALVPAPAQAKGAVSARVSGPGLDGPIRLGNGGASAAPARVSAGELAEATGLNVAVFSTPGDIAPARPDGALGARYIVEYRFMTGEKETIRQELYPFARRGPVSYAPSGQQLSTRPVTTGWYRAGAELRDMLVAAGVPPPRRR